MNSPSSPATGPASQESASILAPLVVQADAAAGCVHDPAQADVDRIFASAASLFAVLSTPMRLRILNALCDGECTVSDIVARVKTSQPNVSQHLAVLHDAGVVARRKDGVAVLYRVRSERAAALCRSVCTQIAIELDEPGQIDDHLRLASRQPQTPA